MIGGFDEAIAAAKDLADIDPSTSAKLIYYPRSRSLFNQYLGSFINLKNSIENPISHLENYVREYNMQPLALMPFMLDLN